MMLGSTHSIGMTLPPWRSSCSSASLMLRYEMSKPFSSLQKYSWLPVASSLTSLVPLKVPPGVRRMPTCAFDKYGRGNKAKHKCC